jgi:hypothetical protein
VVNILRHRFKSEVSVYSMENTKDDSPLKARFFEVRKQIYNRYKEKKHTKQQEVSVTLKRVMSECEWESEVIEINNDITAPGANK